MRIKSPFDSKYVFRAYIAMYETGLMQLCQRPVRFCPSLNSPVYWSLLAAPHTNQAVQATREVGFHPPTSLRQKAIVLPCGGYLKHCGQIRASRVWSNAAVRTECSFSRLSFKYNFRHETAALLITIQDLYNFIGGTEAARAECADDTKSLILEGDNNAFTPISSRGNLFR